ncbi:hypothetical protein TEK04_06885 [Klenkia sp. LSe6-5]|uniref:Lipoprotein n=1 Tax=Klenkia sesuvii TaxID=3103137 RepID=A0ABU8DUD0_9ACTN
MSRHAAVLLALAALTLPGCSLLTPDEAVDAAEQQWAALTPDVRDALGVHDQEESATGNVAEIWVISADLDLDVGGPHGEPVGDSARAGAERTARCLAVARALAGGDLRAYGWLPVGRELVAAGPDTCVRGLGGGWWADGPAPSGPEGSQNRSGSLELARPADGGQAELVGVTVDLDALAVQASSDAPAWTSPVGTFDPHVFDERLRALSTPLPSDLVVSDNQHRQLVVTVPTGTAVSVTATCTSTGPTSGHVAVETATSSTDLSPGTLDPDQVGPMAANCPGTATAPLVPDDQVLTLDGPVDVFLVQVGGVAGTTSYEIGVR